MSRPFELSEGVSYTLYNWLPDSVSLSGPRYEADIIELGKRVAIALEIDNEIPLGVYDDRLHELACRTADAGWPLSMALGWDRRP